MGLLDQILVQCSRGKAANAVRSGSASISIWAILKGMECSVFLGPWFLVVSGCVFAASQLVFDLVGGAVAER